MKSFRLIPVFLTIAMALSVSSCLKTDNDSYTISQAYTNMFNAVVNLDDGQVILYSDQSFKVDWDLMKQTANIQLNGLKIPGGGSFPTLYFDDVPWTYNTKGWYDITLSDYVPTTSSGYNNNLLFNRFNFQTINRTINSLNFPPCLNITYTVNNEFKIFALPMEVIEAGSTTVTAPDGTKYEQTDSDMAIYYLEMDPATKQAFLVIQDAQLYNGMEKTIVKFTPLDMDVNQAGHITCSGTDIVPSRLEQKDGLNGKGEPMSDYLITDFNATYIADYGITMTFKCRYADEVYSTYFQNLYPQTTGSN